jgi:hypothetical protein
MVMTPLKKIAGTSTAARVKNAVHFGKFQTWYRGDDFIARGRQRRGRDPGR